MLHYPASSTTLGETLDGRFHPMPRGRPLAPLTLTLDEQETLQRWVQRRKTAQALALRARLILAAAEGVPNHAIAARLQVTAQTVSKWLKRFLTRRVDGLLDEPRPGAPRTIRDADVERVITVTLETRPEDATHWSTRTMARRVGMSQSAVSRIWRAFGLQPPRSETFKLSQDPLFIEKVTLGHRTPCSRGRVGRAGAGAPVEVAPAAQQAGNVDGQPASTTAWTRRANAYPNKSSISYAPD